MQPRPATHRVVSDAAYIIGEMIMKTIKIKGMSCQHCVKAVEKALGMIDGVNTITVDLAKGEASFEESKPVEEQVIRDSIRKAGYEVG